MHVLTLCAQEVFASLGLDITTAINIFLRHSISLNGIPFPVLNNPWKKMPKPGGWEGKIWMADDFDAPLEEVPPRGILVVVRTAGNVVCGGYAKCDITRNEWAKDKELNGVIFVLEGPAGATHAWRLRNPEFAFRIGVEQGLPARKPARGGVCFGRCFNLSRCWLSIPDRDAHLADFGLMAQDRHFFSDNGEAFVLEWEAWMI